MLRIYDELELHNRVRVRRLTWLLLFAGGLMTGRYLNEANASVIAPPAQIPVSVLGAPTLKLDSRLRTKPQAAPSPLDISLAFPPTAEVLMVSVRSETNRIR